MLRRVFNGWRLVSVLLATALAFLILWSAIPATVLVQILNGVFFGAFVTIVGTYGPILLRTFFGDGRYDRTFHYSLSVAMQWIAMLGGRGSSVWFRIIDKSDAANDTIVVALIAYISLVAIIWQGLVVTEGEDHDRHVLLWSTAAGGAVAITLIVLQSYGTAWLA